MHSCLGSGPRTQRRNSQRPGYTSLTFILASSSSLHSLNGTVHPFPAQLRTLLVRPTAARVQQQAPQEGRGVAGDPHGHDASAADAAVRQPPRVTDGGPARAAPLGAGAGARFQNSRHAVHGWVAAGGGGGVGKGRGGLIGSERFHIGARVNRAECSRAFRPLH